MLLLSLRKRKFLWQKIRVATSRLVQIFVLGRLAGNLAADWVRSISGAYFRKSLQQHLKQVEQLQPQALATYEFPALFPYQFRRQKAFDAVTLYQFTDVIISPYSAITYLPDGLVLEESAGALDKIMSWGKIWPELLLPVSPLSYKGPVIVVPAAPFYHFVWEHVPPLIQTLERYPHAKLLLPPNPPRYVTDYLTLLLGPIWAQNALYHKGLARVPHLLMPQIESYSGFINPAYPALMRKAFAKIAEGEPPLVDKIYVSRKFAPSRLMGNEEELEKGLIAQGFKILYLEKLPIEEQLKAFWRARIIIAPHGAGLSHLHMAQAGACLIEIFPDGYFNDCYARLAVSLGLDYDYCACRPDNNWEGGLLPIDALMVKASTTLHV